MKVRFGFVSNSSSTSFSLFFDQSKLESICPTCGNTHANFFDILEKADDGDTSVYSATLDEKIEEYKQEIEQKKQEISELTKRNQHEYYSEYWQTSVHEIREIFKNDLIKLKKTLKYLEQKKKENKNYVEISISYHNSGLQAMLENMEQAGVIEIFRKDYE